MNLAPDVDFYGDASPWPTSMLVHSERLFERSQVHDWTIRPHRHNGLTQLFLLLEGHGRARMDSVWHAVTAPCLLVIPERVVHEFEWAKESDGYVLSVRLELLNSLTQGVKPLGEAFATAGVVDVSDSREFVSGLFAELDSESGMRRALRDVSLESMIRLIGIWLARHLQPQSATSALPGRAGKHFTRFAALVDEQHKLHRSVPEYANALGITPSHLNSVCRRVVGRTALAVIHARLLLAARRELVYTERNIAGIANNLGFADPSYFTRFFKRETAMTPGEFRRRSGTIDTGILHSD